MLVHPANEPDKVAAHWLLQRLPCFSRLALFIFDSGYDRDALFHWCQQVFSVRTQVTHRGAQTGFQVLPKRWIVERTFGWLNRFRRLRKDYEQRLNIAEGFVYLSLIHLMLNRLTR